MWNSFLTTLDTEYAHLIERQEFQVKNVHFWLIFPTASFCDSDTPTSSASRRFSRTTCTSLWSWNMWQVVNSSTELFNGEVTRNEMRLSVCNKYVRLLLTFMRTGFVVVFHCTNIPKLISARILKLPYSPHFNSEYVPCLDPPQILNQVLPPTFKFQAFSGRGGIFPPMANWVKVHVTLSVSTFEFWLSP